MAILDYMTNSRSRLADVLSWITAVVLVLLPLHALLTIWLGSHTGHLDLIRIWKEILICLIALPAFWLLVRSPDLRQWFIGSKLVWLINIYFLLQIALGLLALHSHRVNSVALIYALIINLRFLDFFLICYVLASYSPVLRTNWLKIVLLPAGVVVAFGLLQQFWLPYDFLKHFGYGPHTIPAYQTVDSDISYQRIQSTLRGANPFGAYLILIMPALLFIKNRAFRLVGLLASVVALYYTYSRSAWIGVLAGLSILLLWKSGVNSASKRIAAVTVGLIVLAGLGFYSLRSNHTAQDALFHTSSTSTNVSSNAKRSEAIKDGLSDVVRQPQGRGPGTAGPASFRNSGHQTRIAEDYYLQIGQEVGVLGLIIFLAINYLVAAELWLKRQDALAQILLASLIGISLVNLVSHAWTDDTLSLLWWGLAGIALAPAILTGSKHKHKT